jgi:acyl-CoA thioesterase
MKNLSPETIAREKMYARDAFSQWLGIEIEEIDLGYCKASMIVREEMLNGFKIAHGGITYSLADSAFAFASNSYGIHAVSIETGISHNRRVVAGDRLTAVAKVQYKGRKTATYQVNVYNKKDDIVALFKGTVYHQSSHWE